MCSFYKSNIYLPDSNFETLELILELIVLNAVHPYPENYSPGVLSSMKSSQKTVFLYLGALIQ